MDELEKLKQAILEDYPHLNETDNFKFKCGSHQPCFNKCCSDVNIFLTPYDVLRMRKAIGMSSEKFLARYTLVPFDKNLRLPVPLMELDDTPEKVCQFVDKEKGCTIYGDRPTPCRMYPLGMGSPGELAGKDQQPFYFVMREDICQGLFDDKEWTVKSWMDNQGVDEYVEFNDLFKDVTLHPLLADSNFKISPKQIDIYWMSLYDLDKFRRFVFESSFLDRIVVSAEDEILLKEDDEALLRFGFKWVRMSLFGEKSLEISQKAKEQVLD